MLFCLVADEKDNEEDEGDLLVEVALIAAGAEERRIDCGSACWCFLLLVASTGCCCCMLLLQVGPAAARLLLQVVLLVMLHVFVFAGRIKF